MFFLRYLRRELTRRRGRTLLTTLGLAVGVALVASVSALSAGLDEAQQGVLDPLASVGTDLVVSRGQSQPEQAGFGPGGAGPGGGGVIGGQGGGSVAEETQSVVTDLSKLGEPGDQFDHSFFLPSTQLSFDETEADAIAELDGVDEVAAGLTVQVSHQAGTVPEIVAEIETGGETIEQEIEIEPLTAEEQAEVEDCLADLQPEEGATDGGGDPNSGAAEPSVEPAQAGPPGGGPGLRFGPGFQECLPERFQRQIARITIPQQTLQQVIDPPETDITTESWVAAGVDASKPTLGLITPAQIVDGEFLTSGGSGEVVVASGHAVQQGWAVGDTITVNERDFEIVGLAKAPLGGQSADVYFHLDELQELSDRQGRVNVVLVRAADAGSVTALGDEIGEVFDSAEVTSAAQLADQVSGSLVDAANLVEGVGVIFGIVVLVVVVALASLLTLTSIAKRTREIGTLKAIGWGQGRVIRQVLGESLVQGLLGGLLGAALGLGAIWSIQTLAPGLTATAPAASGPSDGLFGLGQVEAAGQESATIELDAPIDVTNLATAIALAIGGGLVAGAAGAWRASRLRPADALREV